MSSPLSSSCPIFPGPSIFIEDRHSTGRLITPVALDVAREHLNKSITGNARRVLKGAYINGKPKSQLKRYNVALSAYVPGSLNPVLKGFEFFRYIQESPGRDCQEPNFPIEMDRDPSSSSIFHITVDLSPSLIFLKECAGVEFEPIFNKTIQGFKSSMTVLEFKEAIRLLLLHYFWDYNREENDRPPQVAKDFWDDLATKSLIYTRNKYFYEGQSVVREDKIFCALSDIFNLRSDIFDITPLLEREITEVKTEILETQFLAKAVKRDEAMRLLIYQNASLRLNAHIVSIFELEQFLMNIVKSDAPFRIQIIVRSIANHYTGLDLERRDGRLICFIMDASSSCEVAPILECLKSFEINMILDTFTPEISAELRLLQADSHSCWIFSLDHVIQSSKFSNLFDFLESRTREPLVDGYHIISWFSLPPQFLRNTQSIQLLDSYVDQNPEECADAYEDAYSFVNYIESKTQAVHASEGVSKAINVSTILSVESYKQIVLELMKNLSPSEFSSIIQGSV